MVVWEEEEGRAAKCIRTMSNIINNMLTEFYSVSFGVFIPCRQGDGEKVCTFFSFLFFSFLFFYVIFFIVFFFFDELTFFYYNSVSII